MDSPKYVTKYKVGIANDDTFTQWTDYTDLDKNVVSKWEPKVIVPQLDLVLGARNLELDIQMFFTGCCFVDNYGMSKNCDLLNKNSEIF